MPLEGCGWEETSRAPPTILLVSYGVTNARSPLKGSKPGKIVHELASEHLF